jgi:hypothetical protein
MVIKEKESQSQRSSPGEEDAAVGSLRQQFQGADPRLQLK